MYSTSIFIESDGSTMLPKKLRRKYQTEHYVAEEKPDGIFLRPVEEIEFYEEKDGSFGLRFPTTLEPGELVKMFREASKQLEAEERKRKAKLRKKHLYHPSTLTASL